MNYLVVTLILILCHYELVCSTESFYDFSVKDSQGNLVSLEKYKGKVTLITNVASYCGYTDNHYKGYVDLQKELGENFNILAFPCNQFGSQEPEDVPTIISNMRDKYATNFEIFDKVDVLGDNVPDAWKYLISESKSEPKWNFYKYLVNSDGQVWGAWGPRTDISQIKPYIRDAVRKAKATQDRNEL